MVSKSELQAEIVELKRQASKREFLMEVNERELATHRARESARMRTEHFEQQRKRREAEREDKRKRRQELADGMLRIRDAFGISIECKAGDIPVLKLSVALDGDTYPIVRGVLDKLDGRRAYDYCTF